MNKLLRNIVGGVGTLSFLGIPLSMLGMFWLDDFTFYIRVMGTCAVVFGIAWVIEDVTKDE